MLTLPKYTPAVQAPATPNAALNFTSASAINTHERCPRLWWFQYCKKVRSEQSQAQQLGDQIHKTLEQHFNDPTFPLDSYTLHLRSYVGSLRTTGWKSEAEFLAPVLDGVPVKAKIDLHFAAPAVLQIRDYKSVSDMKWAATDEAVKTDSQLSLYAMVLLDVLRVQPKHIELGQIIIPTKSRTKEPIYRGGVVPVESVRAKALELTAEVQRMRLTAKCVNQDDTVANAGDACEKYGGCHVKEMCSAYKRQPTTRALSVAEEAQVAKILNRAKQPATEEQKEESTVSSYLKALGINKLAPAATTVSAEFIAKFKNGVEQLAVIEAGRPEFGAAYVELYTAAFGGDSTAKSIPGDGELAPFLVNDDDAWRKVLSACFPNGVPEPKARVSAAAVAAPAPVQQELPLPAEAPTTLPTPKRGRPPKAAVATVESAAPAPTPEPVQQELPLTSTAPAFEPAQAAAAYTLYVGCTPSCSFQSLDPWLDWIVSALTEVFGGDVRLSRNEDVGFGRWRAAVAGVVQKNPPKDAGAYRAGVFLDPLRKEVLHSAIVWFRANGTVVLGDSIQ